MFEKRNMLGADDALIREAEGLELIRQAIQTTGSSLCVPELFQVASDCLKMEEVQALPATEEQMRELGEGLALMHSFSSSLYGLDCDNYIGLSRQKNSKGANWGRFFIDQRLGYQLSLIQDLTLRQQFTDQLEAVADWLESYLNLHCSKPSLLHGDLWHGNVLFDSARVWLIDPAAYYGDVEVDIAMTELFGGFSDAFYQSYQQHAPITTAYPNKREIYNLYHYLNHYNLFGDGYLAACQDGFSLLQRLEQQLG